MGEVSRITGLLVHADNGGASKAQKKLKTKEVIRVSAERTKGERSCWIALIVTSLRSRFRNVQGLDTIWPQGTTITCCINNLGTKTIRQ